MVQPEPKEQEARSPKAAYTFSTFSVDVYVNGNCKSKAEPGPCSEREGCMQPVMSVAEISEFLDREFPQIHAGGRVYAIDAISPGEAVVRLSANEMHLRPGGTLLLNVVDNLPRNCEGTLAGPFRKSANSRNGHARFHSDTCILRFQDQSPPHQGTVGRTRLQYHRPCLQHPINLS